MMLRLLAALALTLTACAPSADDPADSSTAATDEPRPAPDGSRADAAPPSGVAPATVGEAHAGEDEADQSITLAFAPGTRRATARDTLGRGALHDYAVRATAGQTLAATLRSDGPPTILVMDDESHRGLAVTPLEWTVSEPIPGVDGTSRGYRWRGRLPADGLYWVRVAHSGPAVDGGAWSPYTLVVEIE